MANSTDSAYDELEMLRKRVQELEGRYRALWDVGFEALLIHEDGVVIDINPIFEDMLGYTLADLQGKSVLQIIDTDYHVALADRLRQGALEPAEAICIRKDGSRIHIELSTGEHTYEGRTLQVVVGRDISLRKKREMQERDNAAFMEALRETSSALNSTLDLGGVMTRILDNVGRVVPHDAANIMVIDGEELYFAHWRGYPPEDDAFFQHYRLPIAKLSNLQQMFQTRQPMAIADTGADPSWTRIEQRNWIKSYASAPIVMDGDVIGFINLNSTSKGALSEIQARRLQSFADQAGVAIKNARLYEDTQEHAAALEAEISVRKRTEAVLERRNLLLETLNDFSREAFDRLEVGYIMDTVARLAAEAIDATSAYVCDWDEESGDSVVLAEYFSRESSEAERISDLGESYHIYDDLGASSDWLNTPDGYHISRIDSPEVSGREREHMNRYGCQVSLRVPLHVNERLIGYIELWETRHMREFTKEEIEAVLAITRQVSTTIEKAQLYEALRESEAQNRAMLNALPDNLFRLSRNGVYIDAHTVGEAPIPRDIIVGKALTELMPPEVAAVAQNYIDKTLATNTMQVYEYQLPEEEGFRDYEARLVVCGPDEVMAIVRDITQRKLAEEALAQARDEALAASRTKSEFLSKMSHELRTPLNSIINYTQMMLEGIYGDLTPTQSDRLEKVARNGRNLLALINDVLDLSKIEGGDMPLQRQPIGSRRLLEPVVDLMKPKAGEKSLVLDFAGGDEAEVIVDEARVRQIFTNLLSNAIKFTHQGGIKIHTHQEKDGLMRFSISDSGIGIPKDSLESIFDEFRQADNSYTRAYEGTGLGLTISRRIAQMHGGSITVESEIGQGSTFHVFLPLTLDAEQPASGHPD